MEGNLEIASAIEGKDPLKVYDRYCKSVLSNKQVIARIMKECVKEYQDILIEEIPSYIEESWSNEDSDKIFGMNVEDEKINGSKICYDVLFQVAIPNKKGTKEKIGLIINLEAQNQDDPQYPLLSRAIYYCSRMLARQKNAPEGFQKSNFQEMKKVYSIWVCMNHTEEKDEVVNHYVIEEKCEGKKWHHPKKDYDMLQVVMMYPSKHYDSKEERKEIMGFLSVMFTNQLAAEEKKGILKNKYGVKMTQTLDEEVERMCNLSQGILEEGILIGKKEGIAIGERKGKREGILEGILYSVKAIMKMKPMSVEDALDLLEVEESLRPQILELLGK